MIATIYNLSRLMPAHVGRVVLLALLCAIVLVSSITCLQELSREQLIDQVKTRLDQARFDFAFEKGAYPSSGAEASGGKVTPPERDEQAFVSGLRHLQRRAQILISMRTDRVTESRGAAR